MKASGPRLSDKGHVLFFPADQVLPHRRFWHPVFYEMEAKAGEREENLGEGKRTAGGKVRGVNQSCETIISLALLPSPSRIKALTVFPLCTKEKKNNSSTSGRLQRDSRRNREREKEKRWITLNSGLGINAHLLDDTSP